MDNSVSRQEFQRELENIYSKLNKHDRQLSVLETLVEALRDLPDAISSLDKTIALMGQNLQNLNEKFDKSIQEYQNNQKRDLEQDELIKRLDDKSKIDIMEFIKENWWKAMLGLAAVIVLLKDFIKV